MAVKAGDKLDATIECPACGGQAHMSVTKNMTVFAYCKTIVDAETGEKCGYRGFLGRTKSKDIIRQYNEQLKELENVQTQHEETTAGIGHNGGPALDDEPSSQDGGSEPKRTTEDFGKEGAVGKQSNAPTPNESIIGGFFGGGSAFD